MKLLSILRLIKEREKMFRELVRIKQKLSMEDCVDVLKTENRGVLSVNGDDGYPYGMPINHFYDERNGKIYFHIGNQRSHRLDSLKKSDKVSFCVFDAGYQKPGEWAYNVRSVIVFGRMKIIDDMDMIVDITTQLCRKFTDDEEYAKEEIRKDGHRTLLLELTPENICGKLVNES